MAQKLNTTMSTESLDTDYFFKNVFELFLKDARTLHGEDFLADVEPRKKDDVNYLCHPSRFKFRHQANNFFKRYVRANEPITPEERTKTSMDGFIRTQERVASKEPLTHRSKVVLKLARKIVKDLIGEFDEEEHLQRCRFGKRAAMGLPFRESYLENRVETLTGSRDHVQWFQDKVLLKDDLLRQCTSDGVFMTIGHLELSTVAKAWDKERVILKNTVIGGFYTAGLGDLLVSRLKDRGIKLSRVPDKHRRRIRKYSKNRRYVTADLSAASDSFCSTLMKLLFPRSWYRAMCFGRINQVRIGKIKVQMSSFMTMGIGFTFPAQTIAFLSILKAICQLAGVDDSGVSVFGDDLLYPSEIHHIVVGVLTDSGFILNKEKTFYHEEFRESCGADYYAGVDVRPYQPQGVHTVLHGFDTLSFLYKTLNGLRLRWNRYELPSVFAYLDKAILQRTAKIHVVPDDYPDYSGIRYNTEDTYPGEFYLLPKANSNWSLLLFQAVAHQGRFRPVEVQLPYLWDSLRSKTVGETNIEEVFGYMDECDSTALTWRRVKTKVFNRFGPPKVKRKLKPFVFMKGARSRFLVRDVNALKMKLTSFAK